MADPYLFHEALYQCVTPLHVGTGQDVGLVDLPVAREVTTDYPWMPGSGIRGSLRRRAEEHEAAGKGGWTEGDVVRIFGTEEGDEPSAGCVSVVDAKLLLFPVRSSRGVFHWVTCPFVLDRYRRDLTFFCGDPVAGRVSVPHEPDDDQYLGTGSEPLHLEEFPFRGANGGWSWSDPLDGIDPDRVVVVHDEVFAHFVRHATLVRTRNRLSTAKTVLEGHLFSVEAVPPEAVLYGFLGAREERKEGDDAYPATTVRDRLRAVVADTPDSAVGHHVFGGDESVGLGLTRVHWQG